ncbi:MAG: cation diffusion facilitator family transporter [Candidatus Sumerlaeota bacterium]|nr:cation diffusion facilitator family transporter [Candidatus Sumerlaeota bacterium]
MEKQARKQAVASLSVASNVALVAGKMIIGVVTGSVSVMSEALHSGIDLLAAIIALFAVRTSVKPADKEHPFGHGKIENLSGVIEAILIFLAAAWIIYEAVHKLIRPTPLERLELGFAVMLVSTVMNVVVSRLLFKVGKETDSVALLADAWHLRTDVWTSAGVMTALAVIHAGQWIFPAARLQWIDPLAAIGVALLILHAAWRLTIQSGRDLLDVCLPEEENAWIREYLEGLRTRGFTYHGLATRKAGATRFVEFDLLVDPAMSVERSHGIAEEATASILAHFPDTRVTVHVEPQGEASDGSPAESGVVKVNQET